jgi:hypothetical protein
VRDDSGVIFQVNGCVPPANGKARSHEAEIGVRRPFPNLMVSQPLGNYRSPPLGRIVGMSYMCFVRRLPGVGQSEVSPDCWCEVEFLTTNVDPLPLSHRHVTHVLLPANSRR